uniref:AB hydrolase-1 domain-containing protein n=1 Tax=Spongospora subterranea TaxID=70186 RepID=A0A0H5QW94_9EUKA|eukprot:CRZ06258.1 hypothetical protein [Spongospora subterranea]
MDLLRFRWSRVRRRINVPVLQLNEWRKALPGVSSNQLRKWRRALANIPIWQVNDWIKSVSDIPISRLDQWRKSLPVSLTWQQRLAAAQHALLKRHVQSPMRQYIVSAGSTMLNTVELPATATESPSIPIVLTHGYGSGVGFWAAGLDMLTEENTRSVYAVDWNGMGGSNRADFNTASDPEAYFIDPLESWRKSVKLEKMALVGHSLGGLLSAAYAMKYPDRVSHLILVSPAGLLPAPVISGKSTLPFAQRLIASGWAKDITPQRLVRAVGPLGQRITNHVVKARFVNMNQDDLVLIANYLYEISAAPPGGEKSLNAMLYPVMTGENAGVYARNPIGERLSYLPKHIPITIMFGDRDWMYSPLIADLPLIKSGRAKLVRIEKSGHHLYIENINQFTDTVLSTIHNNKTPH